MFLSTYFHFIIIDTIALAISNCQGDFSPYTNLENVEANDACLSCTGRRNQKDLYADPNDCHNFFQCFFLNKTTAIGIKRRCADGTFWNDAILQCVPEQQPACSEQQDRCLDDPDVVQRGCYADPKSCAQFFVCSNSISHKMCCPLGTSFSNDSSSCECEEDDTCIDTCAVSKIQFSSEQVSNATNSTIIWNNGTFCLDFYGNLLQVIEDKPTTFIVNDLLSNTSYELECAPGSQFDLQTCRCNNFPNQNATTFNDESRQCLLYLPFDTGYNDLSIHRFKVHNYGYSSISHHNYARGSGSLFVDDGWLEIPGLKTADLGKAASWCFFYRCNEGVDPTTPNRCSSYAGLLSNNRDLESSDYSLVIATTPMSGLVANVRFQQKQQTDNGDGNGIGDANLVATVPIGNYSDEQAFTHICLVYDGFNVSLYVDNEIVSSTSTQNKSVKISHNPYVVGSDQSYGDFKGFIDELLICKRALSADEMQAHFEGQGSLFAAGLIPAPPASDAVHQMTPEYEDAWEKFKRDFNKSYNSTVEEVECKSRFVKKYKILVDHNNRFKKGHETYEMTTHLLMDTRWSTIASGQLGFAVGMAQSLGDTGKSGTSVDLSKLPVRKDWRELGCVNDVRTQGECGACYSFAATAAIEGQYCAKFKKPLEPLSSQQLVDCSTDQGNAGCAGGLITKSFQYYMSAKRFMRWQEYPYVGFGDGICPNEKANLNVPLSIASYVSVPATEDQLLKAVALYGTIACAVEVTDPFIAYNGGVFYDPACTNSVNHAIAIVGYGCTHGTDSNCKGTKYWILRNSWGPKWGENGYMRIARNVKRTCGVETLCSYVVIRGSDNGGSSESDTSSSSD